MKTESCFSRSLTGLVLALSASIAQADIVELHITASWSAGDFDVSSTLFGDDDRVFGVAPSEGSTSFTLLVDTSSVVSYKTGEFDVTHDWFGYSNVTLAGKHTFGSASWETGDILTGLVGPYASTAALWTDTDISIAAPSLVAFRMIGAWPGGNADLYVGDLFVGPGSLNTISDRFLMWEFYKGEEIRRASNAYTASVAVPEPSASESGVYGGVEFPAGAISFADDVIGYRPNWSGGPVPDETQQEARQICGVPGQGEMSLGIGGRVTVRFIDNRLTGSDDSTPDLYIFEVGAPETVLVQLSRNSSRGPWLSVGTATGFASGIDIDQFGFTSNDEFQYVRLIDDGDSIGDDPMTAGADLVAVGARSTFPVYHGGAISYLVQAHVGGRSELIIQGSKLQWHHLKGPAPGLERQFWNPGSDANSPTIVESLRGAVISWVPTGWPLNLGNGTHPESYSSVFDGLTPVLPPTSRCFRVEKLWGDGKVAIEQQPDESNGYALVVRFDDLVMRGDHSSFSRHRPPDTQGIMHRQHGSGFYVVKLIRKGGYPLCWD